MFLRNPRSETNTEDLVSKFFEDFDPEVDLVGLLLFSNPNTKYNQQRTRPLTTMQYNNIDKDLIYWTVADCGIHCYSD